MANAALSNSYGPEAVPDQSPGLIAIPKDSELIPSGDEKLIAPAKPHTTERKQKSLSYITFGFLIFIATAISLGAALGGGLGSDLSSCQNELHK